MRGQELLEKMEFVDDRLINETMPVNKMKRMMFFKQKSTLAFISAVLILGVVIGVSTLWNKEPQHYLQVDWATHYNTIEEMVKESDYIVIAKVSDQSTQLRSDLVFTLSNLNVTKIIKTPGNEATMLTVLQTGGVYQEIETYPIEDVLMLQRSKTYLLFLDYTEEGLCIVMGGYQGTAKIVNDRVVFPNNNAFVSNELDQMQTTQAVELITEIMGN